MERDIRQLKIEYDQYFGGGRKRPPTEIEWRIDQIVKRHSERMGQLKFAQRFRFNNLSQTYAKYKDIFRKRLQKKEEGAVEHHFGAAAKAIEAERAKRAAEHPAPEHKAPEPFRMVCTEPVKEHEKVDRLYEAFVKAKHEVGEESVKLNRSSFHQFVEKKTKALQKEDGNKSVEYVVEVVDGQVKLKALVKS